MFEMDPQMNARKRVGVPFARDIVPSPLCYAVSSDGRIIFSCGHWDNSFKISYQTVHFSFIYFIFDENRIAESSKLTQSITKHKDIVTCLALSSDGQTLVTGSRDTTLMVCI